MRFAYIDSHGNEVPIPSVDALALRIELGAVGPETQLYDAQADLWGPAKTHEIFHTLSRDVDDGGFVPPPPMAPPPTAAAPVAPSKPTKRSKPATARPAEPEPEDEATSEGFDLGLTLAEPPPEPPEPTESEPTESEPAGGDDPSSPEGIDDLPLLDLEPDAEPTVDRVETSAAPEEPIGFDFGDLGGGLELESPIEAAEPEVELDAPMQFDAAGMAADGGDAMVLETPMSQFDPSSPPGWAEETGDDVMDFSTVAAETATEDDAIVPPKEAPARQRRTAKDRPSAPKFKRGRSLSGPIVLVVILLALAVGGYVGWPIVSARLAERNAPERPAVVMPTISPELLERMTGFVDAAIDDVVDDAATATGGPNVPPAPDQEWLAGVYLGNASRYPGIEAFWTSMGRFVDRLRAGDWQGYHDALLERVEAGGVSADDAALLVERADSGFVAAADARSIAYDIMEDLVLSALDLHDFLLDNEDRIAYQPASTSTADPILEAVPDSPELRERMEALIAGYTDALDTALGSVDRATRDRLVASMRDRLQDVGIR